LSFIYSQHKVNYICVFCECISVIDTVLYYHLGEISGCIYISNLEVMDNQHCGTNHSL